MGAHLKLLTAEFLPQYINLVPMDWLRVFHQLRTKQTFTRRDFEFYLQSAAVYSSNIEGNSIDLDSYLKNKKFAIKSKPREMAEIDDLVAAYNFAVDHPLNPENLLESHRILSRHILSVKSQRGRLRDQQVGIYSSGRLEYMAIDHKDLNAEFSRLFDDISILLSRNLTHKEVFYFASLMHLLFEKIHPFMDGNGRAGRLLEKWFLACKLGPAAWSIESEKYYAMHRAEFYKNIHIGVDYYHLNLDRCIPFLLMLPASLALQTQ